MRERINNQIRANEVRVISSEGVNLGVLTIKDALDKAASEGLDLIEISPNTNPPIAKIADYGKYKYEQKKKQQKSKTGAKTILCFGTNISYRYPNSPTSSYISMFELSSSRP